MQYFHLLLIYLLITNVHLIQIDPMGYIVYCPCMGRFGNQADHFLGALGFAKGLNRTLILPPWVEYRYGESKSIQIPFDTYFQVEPLNKFHKVITMEEFMKNLASIEWPTNKRISFCYMARGNTNSCNAKDGNPFGPFWDTFNIDFVESEFYSPLNYDTRSIMRTRWMEKYPSNEWRVLAFTGAPASFPVQFENRHLHAHLIWSNLIEERAMQFIENNLGKGAFIAIHLRNGNDWHRACDHIPDSPNLFSAAQCLGYQNEKGNATREMCLPTKETIVKQLKRLIKKYNSKMDQQIKAIFVSSDSNHMIEQLTESFKRYNNLSIVKYFQNDPHVDLAIMAKSNHFIGNCISSFSAFVKRERDFKGFPSTFWAFPNEKITQKKMFKDEL